MRKLGLCFLAAIVICGGPYIYMRFTQPLHHVTRAAYFWKTNFYAEDIENLKKRSIQKLYIKIMDIGWNPVYRAYPLITTEVSDNFPTDIEVVPVIFITNETMKNCNDNDLHVFAEKLLLKSAQLIKKFDQVKEIQIDCDWTVSSKQNYFKFLSILKTSLLNKKIISATIRLYQYKYKTKAGIPPVDRGMLMLYNMGKINDYNETNSIFNKTEAWDYLQGTNRYTLPLDIALPAFDWAIVFEQKKFSRIMHHFTSLMADTCTFLKKQPNGYYKMTQDYWGDGNGNYLYYGDEIRIEDVSQQALLTASSIASQAVNTNSFTVSLFEVSSHSFHQLDSTIYEKVLDRLK